MSFIGWPVLIEVALASRRIRSVALGPSAPVASIPKGTKSHPAVEHSDEWVASLRASAAAAADATSPRAADWLLRRSGWEIVTSTAMGRGPNAERRMSAGRSCDPGNGTSSWGWHPACKARENTVSRTRLWRR
jgi:hypothetical protein